MTKEFGIDEHKLKYVGYCGCCGKDWESIKEMTEGSVKLMGYGLGC